MAVWTGCKTGTVRDRLVGAKTKAGASGSVNSSYDRILAMQTELLTAGGKQVDLWIRKFEGVPCICIKENQPKSPHSICWGTGWVGGYDKYGYTDHIIYRKESLLYGIITPAGNYDVAPTVNGTEHIVETSTWIDGTGLTGTVVSGIDRQNVTIEYTEDDAVWTSSITFPVVQFKIRATAPDESDFEVARIRGRNLTGDDFILMSEAPPRKAEELLKWGTDPLEEDIRCWTVKDPFIYTADIIEWREGQWVGQRYSVVDKRASQYRISATESDVITQVFGMRHVEPFEQVGRLW